MNKTIYYGIAVLLMLTVIGTAAAVNDTSNAEDVAPVYGCQGQGPNFVDVDGDSVCDNFVDEDGDGISDNCLGYGAGNCGNGPRDGTGYRNGNAGAGGCNGGNCGNQYRYNQ